MCACVCVCVRPPSRLCSQPLPSQNTLVCACVSVCVCVQGTVFDEGLLREIDEEEIARADNRTQDEELRCVLAVIRHGGVYVCVYV